MHRPPGGVAGDTAEEEWYPEISLAPALGMARAPDAGAELSSRHRDGTSMSLAEANLASTGENHLHKLLRSDKAPPLTGRFAPQCVLSAAIGDQGVSCVCSQANADSCISKSNLWGPS